jgi:hypothetical protein
VQICTDFFLKIKSYFYTPFISNTKSLIMANRRNFLKQQSQQLLRAIQG